MYLQTIIIGSMSIGPIERGLRRVREELQRPPSYAWCCPACGEIWARSVIFDETGRQVPFQFLTHPCDEHRDHLLGYLVPGSILLPMEAEFNDALPLPIWQREFQLHDRFIRKNQNG